MVLLVRSMNPDFDFHLRRVVIDDLSPGEVGRREKIEPSDKVISPLVILCFPHLTTAMRPVDGLA